MGYRYGRQHRRYQARLGNRAGHAPHGRRRGILGEDGPARPDEALGSSRAIAAHAGQYHADGVAPGRIGKGFQQRVDRRDTSAGYGVVCDARDKTPCRSADDHVSVAGRDEDLARHERRSETRDGRRTVGRVGELAGEGGHEARREVLDDENRQREIAGKGAEHEAHGMDAARRRPDRQCQRLCLRVCRYPRA